MGLRSRLYALTYDRLMASGEKAGLATIRANGTEKAIYEKYQVDYRLTTDPTVLTE